MNHSPTGRGKNELRRQDFQKQPGRGGVAHFVHIAVDGGGDGSQSRWLEGRGLLLQCLNAVLRGVHQAVVHRIGHSLQHHEVTEVV